MVVSSLTSGGMPSGENLQLYFHEGLRRPNLYPHFQIMDFSISNGNLRCKLETWVFYGGGHDNSGLR